MSLPQKSLVFTQSFILFVCLVFGGSVSAQEINAYLSPLPQNDGDETEIFVEIGTEGFPASNVHSFSATFEAEGFTLSTDSSFSLDPSNGWLLGTAYSFSMTVNSAGTQITLDAWRTDQVGQSGYGFVTKGGSTTCQIDEVGMKKEADPRLRLVSFSFNKVRPLALLAGPNPSKDHLMISHPNQGVLGQISLVNMAGAVVKVWHLDQASARLETLDIPNGLYFLHSKEKGVLRQQKILIQH